MIETVTEHHVDAVVIGAGFGGLYMVHKLRDRLDLNVQGIDKAADVGGTWYWNRYPGARSDTESFIYSYSFDKELLQEWEWSDRYPRQPEILRYLENFADRYDLRKNYLFETEVVKAAYDEGCGMWTVTTDKGGLFHTKYLITALGLLSATNLPAIQGLHDFRGEIYHTGAWPKDDLKLDKKRVGVIGTGSTGVQVVTELGPIVEDLTVFQRSPQYSVPARHGPMQEEFIQDVKSRYDEVWEGVRNSAVAFGFEESDRAYADVPEEEREAVFEAAWQKGGGFRFMFGTFGDIALDPEANEAAAAFIRKKIATIVKDPETAAKLTPKDLYAKRPLCDAGYYEVFNLGNVDVVDIKHSPIAEITATGIRTTEAVYELDVIVFATGFDAVDGNYVRMNLRGRGGEAIKDKWAGGPGSYLGMTTSGFPNMFMILGPNGPFTNLPPSIETQVEWIADAIERMEHGQFQVIEATQEAEANWGETCNEIANMTLFPKAESWIFGANIPGKANAVRFYMGGLCNYRSVLQDVVANDYRGFVLEQ